MEGVRFVPLVLFLVFFFALFYAYYQAMKKIKERENTLEPLVPLFSNSRNLICGRFCFGGTSWETRKDCGKFHCFVSFQPIRPQIFGV